MRDRLLVLARCVAAGACLALSVPPAGFWPLAFVGVALWDQLLADRSWGSRLRRTWLVSAVWLYPTMLWMFWLTPPGYVVACAAYSLYFGAAAALCPPHRPARWIALPAAITLAELARWSQPFEGVPLSTLAMSQADAPLAPVVRVGSALFLSALVVVGGVALSAAWERRWRAAGVAAGLVAAALVLAVALPRSETIGEIDVAAVQGGGPQGTRMADTDEREVFDRHMAASELVETPVDVVLWPENVVNVEGPIEDTDEYAELQELAERLDAVVIPGIVEGVDEDSFANASIVILPDGEQYDRYDKVHRVPFGEYVPLREVIESLDAGVPPRDADAGTGPGELDTPFGRFGVVISWEVFFADRAASGIGDGGVLLLNPTNGSSYTLTQVQSQQIASSRLRALETDRWLVQAAPTGFSAFITPDGEVVERTAISERRVLQHTVELREGTTLAVRYGAWPTVVLCLVALPLAWVVERRRSPRTPGPTPDHASPAESPAP